MTEVGWREPEEPVEEVARPADQAGAEDDPDADQHLDEAAPDDGAAVELGEDEEPE